MNILLTNATFHNGNKGCAALCVSAMSLISELLKERGGEARFFLTDSGDGSGELLRRQTLKAGNLSFDYTPVAKPLLFRLRSLVKGMLSPRVFWRSRRIIGESDAVFDAGQGDSFSDIYGEERFEQIRQAWRLGRECHRPYAALPQTIGPFRSTRLRRRAVAALRQAGSVMVRDSESLSYLRSVAPDIRAVETIDMAFFMPYEKRVFPAGRVHVGLNVSALLWHGGYTRDNQFGLKGSYQRLVRRIIHFFLSQEDVELHLVPHVVSSRRDVENDYAVCCDLAEEWRDSGRVTLAPLFLDPVAAKNYISGMDFFAGARMHAVIAAFSSGVPVVPMAYSRKFSGLFSGTLSYPCLCDMTLLDEDEAFAAVEHAFLQRDNLRAIVADRMGGVVEDRRRVMMDEMARFLGL